MKVFDMFLGIKKQQVMEILAITKRVIASLKANEYESHIRLTKKDMGESERDVYEHGSGSGTYKEEDFEEKEQEEKRFDFRKIGEWYSLFTTFFSRLWDMLTTKWILAVMVKYSLFFIFSIVVGILFSNFMLSELSVYDQGRNEMRVCMQRGVLSHKILFDLEEFVLLTPYSEASNATHQMIDETMAELEELEHNFLFGSSTLKTKGILVMNDAKQKDIMYGDACVYMHTPGLISNCTAFSNGLLTDGLHGAIIHSLYLANKITYLREDLNMTVRQVFTSSEFLEYEELVRVYMDEIMITSSEMLSLSTKTIFRNLKSSLVLSTTLMGLGAGLFYFLYRTNMKRTENVLKHNKSLPLIIPASVANKIEAFLEYGAELARKEKN
jgi:hypothetical protein